MKTKEKDMQKELEKKLEDVINLVSKVLINPDIELEYKIPDIVSKEENENASNDPYILLTYMVNETHTQNQKIPIKTNYLKKAPQDIANLVTFYIEQFIEQIESVEYGAQ